MDPPQWICSTKKGKNEKFAGRERLYKGRSKCRRLGLIGSVRRCCSMGIEDFMQITMLTICG